MKSLRYIFVLPLLPLMFACCSGKNVEMDALQIYPMQADPYGNYVVADSFAEKMIFYIDRSAGGKFLCTGTSYSFFNKSRAAGQDGQSEPSLRSSSYHLSVDTDITVGDDHIPAGENLLASAPLKKGIKVIYANEDSYRDIIIFTESLCRRMQFSAPSFTVTFRAVTSSGETLTTSADINTTDPKD